MLPILPTAACQGKDRWDLTPPTPTHREDERGMSRYIGGGSAPGRYATSNTQYIVSFPSPSSSCLVFSELTQASERLRLTAARGSDSSLFPSFSGSWRSVFPDLQSSSQSKWVSCFHRLPYACVTKTLIVSGCIYDNIHDMIVILVYLMMRC